jgi:hypothetical protein
MSVMFLKESYKAFINAGSTTVQDLLREYSRIDNILAEFNSTVDNTLMDELEAELGDIFDMLDEAISQYNKEQKTAEENYEYELNFKPNR